MPSICLWRLRIFHQKTDTESSLRNVMFQITYRRTDNVRNHYSYNYMNFSCTTTLPNGYYTSFLTVSSTVKSSIKEGGLMFLAGFLSI
jgi:hypothetical protein